MCAHARRAERVAGDALSEEGVPVCFPRRGRRRREEGARVVDGVLRDVDARHREAAERVRDRVFLLPLVLRVELLLELPQRLAEDDEPGLEAVDRAVLRAAIDRRAADQRPERVAEAVGLGLLQIGQLLARVVEILLDRRDLFCRAARARESETERVKRAKRNERARARARAPGLSARRSSSSTAAHRPARPRRPHRRYARDSCDARRVRPSQGVLGPGSQNREDTV